MKELTETQAFVLDFICSFRLRNDYPPTRAEIARHFEWASPNAAQCHLDALAAKGAIRVAKGLSRGITVVAP